MPELPDISLYLDCLRPRIVDQTLEHVRLKSPFLVRTVEPTVFDAEGRRVTGLRRIGKRIVLELDGDLFLVFHLMIAGRFRWSERTGTKLPGKGGLAAFDFATGTLLLVESGTQKRASLHVVAGESALAAFDAGGLNVLEVDLAAFTDVLRRENHTLKRSLTDPRLFDGIGNAYSDEILHAAGLSPVKWTGRLSEDEIARLYRATRQTLQHWIDKLRDDFADRFPGPGDVTAFRDGFAVHGRYGQPCPVCGTVVQRIRYADNETNYCPRCQTNGKVLADRSLSRLLRGDWPRTIEQLEAQ